MINHNSQWILNCIPLTRKIWGMEVVLLLVYSWFCLMHSSGINLYFYFSLFLYINKTDLISLKIMGFYYFKRFIKMCKYCLHKNYILNLIFKYYTTCFVNLLYCAKPSLLCYGNTNHYYSHQDKNIYVYLISEIHI